MYSLIKAVIESGRFELADMLTKIDTMWLQGSITDVERGTLVELARKKADPTNSFASVQNQIAKIFENLEELARQILENKQAITVLQGGEVEPEEPVEEYPEYVQPTGAHDAYKSGDTVTFNGKQYICKMDGCVWSPDVYPDAWTVVE